MRNKIFLIVLLFAQIISAQNEKLELQQFLDSLFVESKNGVKDTAQTIKIQKAFFTYVYNDPPLSKAIADESISLEENSNFPYAITRFYICKGIYYDVIGKKDSAFIAYDKSFAIAKENGDDNAMASVYTNKGLIEWNRENPEQALDYYLKGLKLFEKNKTVLGNKIGMASTINNIGLLYRDMNRFEDSNSYFHKSLKLSIENDDGLGVGAAYSNIASNHSYLDNRDSTRYYLSKSISKQKRNKNQRGLSIDYTNLGQEYLKTEQIDSALFFLESAAAINEKLNANNLKKENLKAIARIYLREKNNPNQAIKYYQKSLQVINSDSSMQETRYKIYQEMSDAFFNVNKFERAAYFRRKASALRDTIVGENQRLATTDIIEKYESEKKEKEILSQRAQLAEKELEVRKKNNLAFGLGGGAILLGLLGYLFYSQQRLKNRQQTKEFELEKALVKIETQNRLQEQRLRISRDLHDNIGSQLTFITSSLDNLKYGMKDGETKVKDKLTEVGLFTKTTINELRDTIWAMNKEAISLGDLEARLGNLLDQARKAADETTFVLDFDAALDRNHALTSVEGMNVYRIIQEAVNNAIKYAGASKIRIALSRKQNHIHVQIKDNGKGFDTTQSTMSNGLSNMKKRARDIRATYDISSKENQGTVLELEVRMT